MKKNKVIQAFLLIIVLIIINISPILAGVTKKQGQDVGELYNYILNNIYITVDDLDLTTEEQEKIEDIKRNQYYYIPYNRNIMEEDMSLERLIIDIINKVLDTNIIYYRPEQEYYIDDSIRIAKENSNYLFGLQSYNYDGEQSTKSHDGISYSNYFEVNEIVVVYKDSVQFKENVTFYRDILDSYNHDKIAISESIAKTNKFFNSNTNKNKQLQSMDEIEARQKLIEDNIDIYMCSINELYNIMESSDLKYTFFDIVDYNGVSNPKISIASSSSNESLISVINKIFVNLDKESLIQYDDFYEIQILQKVFFNSLNDAEKNYIQEGQTINVTINEVASKSRNEEAINHETYIVDILDSISFITGIDIEYKKMNYNEVIDNIISGEINILPLTTEKSAKNTLELIKNTDLNVNITNPIINHKVEILKKYSTADFKNIVYLQSSSIGYMISDENWVNEYIKDNTGDYDVDKTAYDDMDDLIDALENEEVEYIIVSPGTGKYIHEIGFDDINYAYNKNEDIGDKSYNWVLYVSDGENTDTLTSIINKANMIITEKNLFLDWLNYNDIYYNFVNLKKDLDFYSGVLIIIISASLILIYNNSRNKHLQNMEYMNILNKDKLTDLNNINKFKEDIKNKKDFLCIGIDIDKFKELNNAYGIVFCDKLLIGLAKRLEEIAEIYNLYIYRFEKDQFVILTKFYYNEEQTIDLLETISILLRQDIKIEDIYISFKVSIGAVSSDYVTDKSDSQQVIDFVFDMVKKQKISFGSKYTIFSEEDKKQVDEIKDIESQLYTITEENVEGFYQPFISSRTGEIIGCEVLARLKLNDVIYPAYKFIPVAEINGTLKDIDELLFKETFVVREKLMKEGLIDDKFYFSVNISAQFLKQLNGDYLDEIIKEFNLKDLSFMQFEVLETELTEDEISKIYRLIEDKNIRSAVDDFSTGYSSLTRATTFNFSTIKFDRSLLPIEFTKNDKKVYTALLDIINEGDKDITIVAEGVETQQHVDFLTEKGVDTFQGFYFSKPVQYEDFVKIITKFNYNEE